MIAKPSIKLYKILQNAFYDSNQKLSKYQDEREAGIHSKILGFAVVDVHARIYTNKVEYYLFVNTTDLLL